jgi:hypothetical protein
MDEADRMFDMGFEPQVMKIINNIRPDRQTVLFSATFPKQMEALARKVLEKPVEIQVCNFLFKKIFEDTKKRLDELIRVREKCALCSCLLYSCFWGVFNLDLMAFKWKCKTVDLIYFRLAAEVWFAQMWNNMQSFWMNM